MLKKIENSLELTEKNKKKRDVSLFREIVELFSETLIYVLFVMTFLLQSFVIPTGSMQDNILIGDHILVDKVAYSHSLGFLDGCLLPRIEIKRGMIVTFKSPPELDKEYVKRVIGLPGERIKVINKMVYINDKLLYEPYVFFKDPNIEGYPRDNYPEFRIPEDYYFCMGDNRDNSSDSRFWGPVHKDLIIGKPWRIYWSFEATSDDYLRPGMDHKIKEIIKTIRYFFTKTRWERTIKKIE